MIGVARVTAMISPIFSSIIARTRVDNVPMMNFQSLTMGTFLGRDFHGFSRNI